MALLYLSMQKVLMALNPALHMNIPKLKSTSPDSYYALDKPSRRFRFKQTVISSGNPESEHFTAGKMAQMS